MARRVRRALAAGVAVVLGVSVAPLARGETGVCVEVRIRHYEEGATRSEPEDERPSGSRSEEGEASASSPSEREDRGGGDGSSTIDRKAGYAPESGWPYPPQAYLERLLEHFVTHEQGYVAVDRGCDADLRVGLYPLRRGWTVFARYSGTQREEKVDEVGYEELPRLADRVVPALLHRKGLDETIDRTNVLEADSREDLKTIRGEGHFLLGVGSSIGLPTHGIPTAQGDPTAPVEEEVRPLTSVDLGLGYRGNFRKWGVNTLLRVDVSGGQRKTSEDNVLGGHVESTAALHTGVDVFWYLAPDAVNSIYAGLGGRLDVSFFRAVEPTPEHRTAGQDNDRALAAAGFSGVGLVGYEFLRTNEVRPFVQLDLTIPTYRTDAGNDFGRVESWMPSLGLRVGALF